MTLREIDRVLRFWNERLVAIAEELLKLQDDARFRSVSREGGAEHVAPTGATAAHLEPALAALRTVFVHFGLLQSAIARATTLRGELPAIFGGEAKGRELGRLLYTRHIALLADGAPGDHGSRVSLEELRALVEQGLAGARGAILSVERAWAECQERCDAAEQEVTRLRVQRVLPSALLGEALDDAQRLLQGIRGQLRTDPLGAEQDVRGRLEPALAEIAAKVDKARHLRGELQVAGERLGELEAVHKQGVASSSLLSDQRACVSARANAVPDELVAGLRVWWSRLEQKYEDGVIEAVAIGLRNWNLAAERCVQQDRKAQNRMRAEIEQRGELEGRIGALQAKARVRGLLADKGAMSLLSNAKAALLAQPTDLQHARAAVSAYERYLQTAAREA